MVPRSGAPPAEPSLHKKLGSLSPSAEISLHSGKQRAFSYSYSALLILGVLSLQLLLLLLSSRHFSPASHLTSHRPVAVAAPSQCDSGLIYIYDVPPKFNRDLIADCSGINPWGTRCGELSNGGFGLPAADLAGIVPSSLLPSWFSTDQFIAELIFHRRMLSHRCRTPSPSDASAFYIPFYAGLAVGRHLWSSASTSAERDRACAELLSWIAEQPAWRESGGWDHFIALGRITWDFRRMRDGDWGGSFLYMPGMANVTRLLIERNPWDEREVGIPYPTGFHPRSAGEVRAWQEFALSRPRRTLFSFAGAARSGFRNDFRGLLLGECARAGDACKAVDCRWPRCGNSSAQTLRLFLDSVFCLQPRGDSFTRRSLFDCMIAGSIPVIFWRRSAYEQYMWHLPEESKEAGDWSVFIDRRELTSGAVSLRGVLDGMGEEKVRRMRERVVELIPRLVYGGTDRGLGEGMDDAFDMAVAGVLRRFRGRRRPTV